MPTHDALPGIYRGVVLDVNDPLQIGRLRVQVLNVHPREVPTNSLPWACPAGLYTDFPEYKETVWVMFERGDKNYPVWFGRVRGAPGRPPVSDVPKDMTKNSGQTTGVSFPAVESGKMGREIKVRMDKATGYEGLRVTFPSGTEIFMQSDPARIEITNPKGTTLKFDEAATFSFESWKDVFLVMQQLKLITQGPASAEFRSNLLLNILKELSLTIGGRGFLTLGGDLQLIILPGKLVIGTAGNVEVTAGGDAKVTAAGKAEVTAAGDVDMSAVAGTINLSGKRRPATGGVLTTENIDSFTGAPYSNGSQNVKASQ